MKYLVTCIIVFISSLLIGQEGVNNFYLKSRFSYGCESNTPSNVTKELSSYTASNDKLVFEKGDVYLPNWCLKRDESTKGLTAESLICLDSVAAFLLQHDSLVIEFKLHTKEAAKQFWSYRREDHWILKKAKDYLRTKGIPQHRVWFKAFSNTGGIYALKRPLYDPNRSWSGMVHRDYIELELSQVRTPKVSDEVFRESRAANKRREDWKKHAIDFKECLLSSNGDQMLLYKYTGNYSAFTWCPNGVAGDVIQVDLRGDSLYIAHNAGRDGNTLFPIQIDSLIEKYHLNKKVQDVSDFIQTRVDTSYVMGRKTVLDSVINHFDFGAIPSFIQVSLTHKDRLFYTHHMGFYHVPFEKDEVDDEHSYSYDPYYYGNVLEIYHRVYFDESSREYILFIEYELPINHYVYEHNVATRLMNMANWSMCLFIQELVYA